MARQGDPHPFWRSLVEEPYSTLNLAYRSYGRPAHSGNGAQTVRPICNHGPADAVGIAAGLGRPSVPEYTGKPSRRHGESG